MIAISTGAGLLPSTVSLPTISMEKFTSIFLMIGSSWAVVLKFYYFPWSGDRIGFHLFLEVRGKIATLESSFSPKN